MSSFRNWFLSVIFMRLSLEVMCVYLPFLLTTFRGINILIFRTESIIFFRPFPIWAPFVLTILFYKAALQAVSFWIPLCLILETEKCQLFFLGCLFERNTPLPHYFFLRRMILEKRGWTDGRYHISYRKCVWMCVCGKDKISGNYSSKSTLYSHRSYK